MKMQALLRSLNLFLITGLLLLGINSHALESNTPESKVKEWMKRASQFGFMENKGQMTAGGIHPADFVLFKAEAPGLNIWVTTSGLTYQFFTKLNEHGKTAEQGEWPKIKKEKKLTWHRVDMILKGANIQKENIYKEGEIVQGNTNYYLGHCPDGIFNVKTFTEIIIKDVYPGIDWFIYTSKTEGLKHDFIVHPGADPKLIKLIYEGSGSMNIIDNQIKFNNELGELTEGELLSYQGNKANIIGSTYKATKNNYPTYLGAGNHPTSPAIFRSLTTNNKTVFSYEVNIELGDYNTAEDLIIDPQLTWGTLYGGNELDGFMSMDTDNDGNLFVTGYTTSDNFPTDSVGGVFYQGTYLLGYDAVILKFDNNGIPLWATYYGGSLKDEANYIKVNNAGDVYVTGMTNSTNFPTDSVGGAYYQGTIGAVKHYDVFIVRFNNNGGRLWASYYGGSLGECGNSIDTDDAGNVWITGWTLSSDLPTDSLSGAFFQGTNKGLNDAFILKFDNNNALLWASYYGGSANDLGNSIAVDNTGNVWVTGQTESIDFPKEPLSGAFFQSANAGLSDAFILKFNNNGVRQWGTYFGGSDGDYGNTIAVDNSGAAWITGQTQSMDFPTDSLPGAFFQGINAGLSDIFILKFNNNAALLWATYFGGNGSDSQTEYDNIAIDECDNASVSFLTGSSSITTLNPGSCHYYDGTYGGDNDCYITQFNNMGNLLWASYIGSDSIEQRTPLAIDKNNNLFMGGEFKFYTNSSSLPMQDPGGGGYFVNTPAGLDDSYILKFIPSPLTTSQSQVNSTICSCNGSVTANITCGLPPYSYVWNNGSQTINTKDTFNTITGLCPGSYSVIVNGNCKQKDTLLFSITGVSNTGGQQTLSGCTGFSITVNGNIYDSTGIYVDTLIGGSFNGCDSILTTDLTISPIGTGQQTLSACTGFSITVNGNIYDSTGIYVDTLIGASVNGCDSILTTDLTISPFVAGQQTMSACTGFSITVNGNIYDSTGVYIDTLAGGSVNGCDSILTTNLIISPIATQSLILNECKGFSITINGNTYSTTGSYTDTLTGGSVNNCDSVINLDLTILQPGSLTQNIKACNGYSITINGNTYNTTGVYIDTLNGASLNGCDSIINTNLTINPLPNAGTDSSIMICTIDSLIDMISFLGGNPDPGGVWSPLPNSGTGMFNPSIDPSGNYIYAVNGPPCPDDSSILTITIGQSPTMGINTTDDNCAQGTGSIDLDPITGIPPYTYLWNTGLQDSVLSNLIAGVYTVIVSDSAGCISTYQATINDLGLNCDYLVYLPNVFSPNEDGDNDVLYVRGQGIQAIHLVIYNRWGDKVFETNSITEGWDGTYKDKPVNSAVFAYYLHVIFTNGEIAERVGNVSIVK